MTLTELIERAALNAGSLKQLAEAMGKHQNRLTEWKKGTHKPDADEIAFLARNAGLPVIETIAEIERGLNSRYASIWSEAAGKLKAAGIAATVAGVMLTQPSPSEAMTTTQTVVSDASLYIMSTIRRMLRRLLGVRLNPRHA